MNAAGPGTPSSPTGGPGSPSTSTPPGTGSRILGARSDRCLGLPNATRTNGTRVQLYDCGNQANQRFSLS